MSYSSTEKKFQLTRETIMSEIVEKSPKATELLAEYGLHCLSCFANQFDTLGNGALIHGMNDEEIDQMIKEVNDELCTSTEELK